MYSHSLICSPPAKLPSPILLFFPFFSQNFSTHDAHLDSVVSECLARSYRLFVSIPLSPLR
ncbi:hypothetical protein PITC_095630 [Penicillium italicum]|uniref:Uncharacterized protein n=1 Tax=Penicillium italicum TaxID=40296 RepID=A0A0A2KQR3_PENIT|nr:hypothetical protein PITC_095630 [Penicillium italicum]